MKTQQIKIRGDVVRIVDLEPITVLNGEDVIQFRIEIIRLFGQRVCYEAKIWRLESYRVQPSFPRKGKKLKHTLSDERFYVEDVSIIPRSVRAKTINSTLQAAFRELKYLLSRYGLTKITKSVVGVS